MLHVRNTTIMFSMTSVIEHLLTVWNSPLVQVEGHMVFPVVDYFGLHQLCQKKFFQCLENFFFRNKKCNLAYTIDLSVEMKQNCFFCMSVYMRAKNKWNQHVLYRVIISFVSRMPKVFSKTQNFYCLSQ